MSRIVNGNSRFLVAAPLLIASAGAAHAQTAATYPSRAIRIVVPFAPAGPNDILARAVGQKIAEALGRQVVVDNRPGGGTVIGTEAVANAPPDGHTLLMVSLATAVNPVLRSKLPYDAVRDFAPVVRLADAPNVLVVHPSLPVKSVRELIALAQGKPDQIVYGSGGVGGATHLAGELLCITGKVRMTHVPYSGAAPVTIDLMRGEVQWMFASVLPTLPQVRAGRMRAIAVSGAQRIAALPDAAPVADALPGFEAVSWFGVFAPAKTPRDIIAKLNAEMVRALESREIRERLQQEGAVPAGGSPEDFAKFFQSEMTKWANVVRTAGIKAQ
jgi:tripartite-type tricarboxylate transporter receptor subunit TctC